MSKIIFRLFLSFALFVTLFILIQRTLTPDSFGKYGHYRANSIDDNKLKTSYYKGKEACVNCHQESYELVDSDLHAEINCESCHPPKIDALTDCEVMPPIVEGTNNFCAVCHATNPGRLKRVCLS